MPPLAVSPSGVAREVAPGAAQSTLPGPLLCMPPFTAHGTASCLVQAPPRPPCLGFCHSDALLAPCAQFAARGCRHQAVRGRAALCRECQAAPAGWAEQGAARCHLHRPAQASSKTCVPPSLALRGPQPLPCLCVPLAVLHLVHQGLVHVLRQGKGAAQRGLDLNTAQRWGSEHGSARPTAAQQRSQLALSYAANRQPRSALHRQASQRRKRFPPCLLVLAAHGQPPLLSRQLQHADGAAVGHAAREALACRRGGRGMGPRVWSAASGLAVQPTLLLTPGPAPRVWVRMCQWAATLHISCLSRPGRTPSLGERN